MSGNAKMNSGTLGYSVINMVKNTKKKAAAARDGIKNYESKFVKKSTDEDWDDGVRVAVALGTWFTTVIGGGLMLSTAFIPTVVTIAGIAVGSQIVRTVLAENLKNRKPGPDPVEDAKKRDMIEAARMGFAAVASVPLYVAGLACTGRVLPHKQREVVRKIPGIGFFVSREKEKKVVSTPAAAPAPVAPASVPARDAGSPDTNYHPV